MIDERKVLVEAVETGPADGSGGERARWTKVERPRRGEMITDHRITRTDHIHPYIDLPVVARNLDCAVEDIPEEVEGQRQEIVALELLVDDFKRREAALREALGIGPDDDVVEAVRQLRASDDVARMDAARYHEELIEIRRWRRAREAADSRGVEDDGRPVTPHRSGGGLSCYPTALDLIATERRRQVSDEGWTPEHDDQHVHGALAKAAACLAVCRTDAVVTEEGEELDVWGLAAKHRNDPIRQLAIAGALIVAELERIQRAGGVASAGPARRTSGDATEEGRTGTGPAPEPSPTHDARICRECGAMVCPDDDCQLHPEGAQFRDGTWACSRECWDAHADTFDPTPDRPFAPGDRVVRVWRVKRAVNDGKIEIVLENPGSAREGQSRAVSYERPDCLLRVGGDDE